jgi:uncharacterized YccA/Bax inhibitor family protein
MASLRSSNPAFTSGTGFNTPSASELDAMYGTQPRMTIDDVIMHTAGLMALLFAAAVGGWQLSPNNAGLGFAAGLTALALSFLIGFSRVIRPPLVIVFAVLEGLFIGAISRVYETQYSGIVTQALIGTGVIFASMLLAYRSGRLRATPRMRKIVFGTLMGVVGLSLVDLGLRAFGTNLPILNDATPLGILLSVGILVVASLQFVLDFDYIERAIAAGAPRSEAWRASYGLLVGFIWVYLELLRLLSKLRR